MSSGDAATSLDVVLWKSWLGLRRLPKLAGVSVAVALALDLRAALMAGRRPSVKGLPPTATPHGAACPGRLGAAHQTSRSTPHIAVYTAR